MFCTKCGSQIPDDVRFCTKCGAPVTTVPSPQTQATQPVQTPTVQMPAAQPPVAQTAKMPPAQQAPAQQAGAPAGQRVHKASGKTRAIVIGAFVALAVLAAAAAAAWFFFIRTPAPTPVVFAIEAAGLDSATGTKIPVHIEGEDIRGHAVSEDHYLSSDGTGMELVDGTYELTVTASPIAADGTIYDIEDAGSATLELEGDRGTVEGSIVLEPIPAAEVTDEEIEAAYEAALAGGAEDAQAAEALRDAATARRDEAVAAEQEAEAERQRQEEEARRREEAERAAQGTYQTDSFSFDIPSYWEGRVTVQIEGDSVTIWSSAYPEREVATLDYISVNAGVGTDIGGANDATGDLGNGMMVYLYAPNYAYRIAYANISGSTDPNDYYSLEEAQELVDLQSAGTVDYEDYLQNMRDNGGNSPTQDMLTAAVQQIDIDDFNVRLR